jgi:O-acetyl-ADP-ribose deacetylase (regulator of RNase III)
MIDFYKGDIFTAPINVLVHSANCFHTMGAGIAKDIKLKYPRAYQSDCLTKKGDKNKLGQFSLSAPAEDQPFYILNCYTQYNFGRDKVYVQYDKFYEAMKNVNNWVTKMEIEKPVIGIPKFISCRNAGGNWDKIYSILHYVFNEDASIKLLICQR